MTCECKRGQISTVCRPHKQLHGCTYFIHFIWTQFVAFGEQALLFTHSSVGVALSEVRHTLYKLFKYEGKSENKVPYFSTTK
jgi:hypothetical protein